MLQSLILPMKIGVSYGSGALKALQTDKIPELDLLVREAIQNSSDAAINEPEDSCNINFTQGAFRPTEFNAIIPDIGPILDDRFRGETADYLEIRDYKTSGLTGPILQSKLDPNDHGNYWKLVFDTGKEQTNSSAGEAGGSWGYGKSVYYRVGIGLVVFYSQIRENGEMKSRLIISLIENETNTDAMLSKINENAVGRAWWGKTDPCLKDELLPVTDEDEIQKILDIFSVRRFPESQTGTAIIIPYIDKVKLLQGIFPDNCGIPEDEISICSFKDDVAKYIELAVQKWYAPRVFNKELKRYSEQKWLAIRVNGNPITHDNMRPLFRLIQELYTSAISENCHGVEPYKSELYPFIKCVSIPSQKLVGGSSGHAAYIQVSKDELGAGSIIKPYTYLRKFGKSALNDPIVMFARTPGMILDYEIDGKWAKGLNKPEVDDEYIFVFYVPDCTVEIKSDSASGEYAGIPFGEFLRKSEKSDHMDWEDPASYTLLTNIKSQLVNKVNNALKGSDDGPIEGTTSKLSGKLGKRLLPTTKFGRKGSSGGNGNGGSGGAVNNFEFILGAQEYIDDCVVIDFSAKFFNTKKTAVIGVFVISETGLMDYMSWLQNIGTAYPITIEAIWECSTFAQNSGNTLILSPDCELSHPQSTSDYSTVTILNGDENCAICGIEITNTITNAIVSGKLIVRTANKKIRCILKETKKPIKE